jgi:hypothetical protein
VWSRAKGPCDVPPSPCNRASSEGSRYVQVFLGSAPITLCPRLPPKRAGSQVPSLRRCYPASTVLRTCPTPDQAATSVSLGSLSPPARASPDNPCHLACVLCPLPRRSRTGALAGFLPRPTRPSPLPSRVGDRIATFEACSGFTRVRPACLLSRLRGLRHRAPTRPVAQTSRPSATRSNRLLSRWTPHPLVTRAYRAHRAKAQREVIEIALKASAPCPRGANRTTRGQKRASAVPQVRPPVLALLPILRIL